MLNTLRRWLLGEKQPVSRTTQLQLQSLDDRCVPAADIVAQSLTWDTAHGSAIVDFAVMGDKPAADTSAGLYWATGPAWTNRLGNAFKLLAINRSAADVAPVNIVRAALATRPAKATHLLLVTDPLNRVTESDETNNVQALTVPDVRVRSVTTEDSRRVTVNYEVTGIALDAVPLRLVRSIDTRFDVNDLSLAPAVDVDGSIGTHTVTFDLDEPLAINPSRPYVLAQADTLNAQFEVSEVNNAGWFRKRELGVVTHGFNLFGGLRFAFPAWITDVAARLRYQGYDRAIAFDWTKLSNDLIAGRTGVAAAQMTARIEKEIAAMKALWPNDVIDLHLIGHSRGGPVISQAAELLDENIDVIRGTLRLTFLDPHPASNANGHTYASAWLIGLPVEQLYLAFQNAAQDPNPVVGVHVDYADHLYQRTDTSVARSGGGERILNLWGNVPIQNFSPFALNAIDLTAPGMSHGAVINWFMRSMLPQLGRGLA